MTSIGYFDVRVCPRFEKECNNVDVVVVDRFKKSRVALVDSIDRYS